MAASARMSGTVSPNSFNLKRGSETSRHWRARATALALASRARRARAARLEYRRVTVACRFLTAVLTIFAEDDEPASSRACSTETGKNVPRLSNTSATLAIKRVRIRFTGEIPLMTKRLSYKPLIGIIADNL